MVPASASVSMVDQDHKNGCHQCLSPQRESQLSPASPAGSPRSASRSDPDAFQTAASVLGLKVSEVLCVPFKSGVSVFYSPLALPNISPTGFQSQIFGGLVFSVQDPQAGDPDAGLRLLAPWENLHGCDFPPTCRLPHWECGGLTRPHLCSPCSPKPASLWLLLYLFSCGKSFSCGMWDLVP